MMDPHSACVMAMESSSRFENIDWVIGAGLITADAIRFSLLVGPVYGIGVWFGARLFGRASEKLFRATCYALIAAAVMIGLPALDGVLR